MTARTSATSALHPNGNSGGLQRHRRHAILVGVNPTSFDDSLDALCERQCAFALYRLPGGRQDHFCMQRDGKCGGEDEARAALRGEAPPAFVISPFSGSPACIKAEISDLPRPGHFRPLAEAELPPATDRRRYGELFNACLRQLDKSRADAGALRKIVLARCADEPRPAHFRPSAAFRQLCEDAPRSFRALIHCPAFGTWLCATPELLISGSADSWETMALAGTRVRSDAPWDAKNREEQALVVRHIREAIASVTEPPEEQPAESLPAGAIEHLCSRMSFRMSRRQLPRLLDELQPTPAVSGYPVRRALDYLREHPDTARDCYAGFLGPTDAESARLFVMLRCMRVLRDRCRLYAGGGIMPDSREEAEWQETEAKMRPMRRLLLQEA